MLRRFLTATTRVTLLSTWGWHCAATTSAQQANVGVPFGQLNQGFFEQSGVGFNLSGPGFFFQQNSFGPATPQFGNFDPGAGAGFGFGFNRGQTQGNFNFALGQGSRSSFVSQTPSTTIGNGGTGGFSAGSWTPFVAGAIPVVGDGGGVPFGPAGTSSVLQERVARLPHEAQPRVVPDTGNVAVPANDPARDGLQRNLAAANNTRGGAAHYSIAEIEQLRAATRAAEQQATQAEVDRLLAQADAALQANKPAIARIYLQQAATRSEGAARQAIQDRLQGLRGK